MKLLAPAALSTLLCISSVALAEQATDAATSSNPHGQGHQDKMHSRMKSMDGNGDGVITKEEFMAAHQSMWEKLPKNSAGVVSIADMDKMRQKRMAERRAKMLETKMQNQGEKMPAADAATGDEAEKVPAN
jgi:hypothetical protein